MDWTEAPTIRRKSPANGYSPILPPPRHVSTLPDPGPTGRKSLAWGDWRCRPRARPSIARCAGIQGPKELWRPIHVLRTILAMTSQSDDKLAGSGFDPRETLRLMEELLAAVPESLPGVMGIAGTNRKKLRQKISALIERLKDLSRALDPVGYPAYVLDPSDPQIMGTLIANTLLAQPRQPLKEIRRFYGSGVYALYYRGDFGAYKVLTEAEIPIYVGKADPAEHGAESVEDQGESLSIRLRDHQRSITAAENLRIEDFDCRYLVVKSAWQNTAETYLIQKFKPVWNNEVNICFGFGKHGDSSDTRKNTRSPWDTLHPGRLWAMTKSTVPNPQTVAQIKARIVQHLKGIIAGDPPAGSTDKD
jgi:Eco29kI restriction endonuclease